MSINSRYDFNNTQDYSLFQTEDTMQLRNNKQTEQVKNKNLEIISRDMILQNSLKIYHTSRNKLDNTMVDKTTIKREILEMNLFKRGVKGHAIIQI